MLLAVLTTIAWLAALPGNVSKDCWLKPIPDLDYDNPCVLRGDWKRSRQVA